jgi:hypothetical protein
MIKNAGASIFERLKQTASAMRVSAPLLRARYLNECLARRLAFSEQWHDKFAIKGGMMIPVWSEGDFYRPTSDLDLTCIVDIDIKMFLQMVQDLTAMTPESQGGTLPFDDGLVFDKTVFPKRQFEGHIAAAKFTFKAKLHTAELAGTIDITSKLPVVPGLVNGEYPSLLRDHKKAPLPAPTLSMYPPETTVAEKFHAMAEFGSTNHRIKDYYDLYALRARFDFDDDILAEAICATFERQGRPIPEVFVGLNEEFVQENTAKWIDCAKSTNLKDDIPPFEDVVQAIADGYGEALAKARQVSQAQLSPTG